MQEREFSNIFTFAPGFEAASLKFPNAPSVLTKETSTPQLGLSISGSGQSLAAESILSPDADELSILKADDEESTVSGEQPSKSLWSAAASVALGLGFDSTASSSTTSLVGMTRAGSSGTTVGGSVGGPPRRQVIGFARFKTRADALLARDTLQGRRIDVFSGAMLKVEMAKKNLHSRRGFGGSNTGPLSLVGVPESEIMDVLMRSGKLPGLWAGAGLGSFGLSRERSNGSQGRRASTATVNQLGNLGISADNQPGRESGSTNTPSGRRTSLSESFSQLSRPTSHHQPSHFSPTLMPGHGGPATLNAQPMPSLGQATEETSGYSEYGSTGRLGGSGFSTSLSNSSRMNQGAPAFSPRYGQTEFTDQSTPMNNKTFRHSRSDSLRNVFDTDWTNKPASLPSNVTPLGLSQVPEHPAFLGPYTGGTDRRISEDQLAPPPMGTSMPTSMGPPPPPPPPLGSSNDSGSAGYQAFDRLSAGVGIIPGSDQMSPSIGFTSPLMSSVPRDSKALLALAEAEDEDWNVGGVGMEALGPFDGESRNNSPGPTMPTMRTAGHHMNVPMGGPTHHSSFDPVTSAGPLPPRGHEGQPMPVSHGTDQGGEQPIPDMNHRRSMTGLGASAAAARPPSEFGINNVNLADQNPPINTLYVGNLPSHLAATQSPNFLEECLRNLFSRALGFKRMSFRQKVNGPMCFVEVSLFLLCVVV